jgi:NAD(P)-dependent dehydrogenase (short-subunit alcohol dehydrogenase family)
VSITGKVVAITGGTGGLGQDVTLAFLEAGASCAVTFTNPGPARELEAAATEHNDRLLLCQTDVTDPTSVAGYFRAARERFGGVDALLHLVGGFSGGETVAETSPEIFDRMIALNLKSAFLTCRAVVPLLVDRGGGKIMLVSARAALKGTAGLGAYSISKAGILTLTETLADELREHNVQVNCILPSIIDTAANRRAMPDADASRWVAPAEIAHVLLFLAGPDADVVSGAAIPVYGRA